MVRYRLKFPCDANRDVSYFQGEVIAVEPDFGGADGGVRLALTVAPWPTARREKGLELAAAVAAARAARELENRRTRGFWCSRPGVPSRRSMNTHGLIVLRRRGRREAPRRTTVRKNVARDPAD